MSSQVSSLGHLNIFVYLKSHPSFRLLYVVLISCNDYNVYWLWFSEADIITNDRFTVIPDGIPVRSLVKQNVSIKLIAFMLQYYIIMLIPNSVYICTAYYV